MHWKKHSPDEIVAKLGAVRDAVAAGCSLSDAIHSVGVSQATYFRWRSQFGELDSEQIAELRRLEHENQRLRRALAELEYAVTA